MKIKALILMDPMSTINYKKDSSLAIALAIQRKGWALSYMEASDLYWEKGLVSGHIAPLEVQLNPQNWYHLGPKNHTHSTNTMLFFYAKTLLLMKNFCI